MTCDSTALSKLTWVKPVFSWNILIILELPLFDFVFYTLIISCVENWEINCITFWKPTILQFLTVSRLSEFGNLSKHVPKTLKHRLSSKCSKREQWVNKPFMIPSSVNCRFQCTLKYTSLLHFSAISFNCSSFSWRNLL